MENITDYNILSLFPEWYEVFFLHAHPDDETFLNLGLIDQLNKLWRKCWIIYCSAWLVENNEETKIRQQEIKGVIKKYLSGVNIIFLPYSDCSLWNPLQNHSIQDVVNSVLINISCIKQCIFVWYDYRWGYGHKDHKTVHTIWKYLAWIKNNSPYYESTINEMIMNSWIKLNETKLSNNELPKTEYRSSRFWTPTSKIGYVYTLTDDQILKKRNAFCEYKSQINPNEFPLSLDTINFSFLFWQEYLNV